MKKKKDLQNAAREEAREAGKIQAAAADDLPAESETATDEPFLPGNADSTPAAENDTISGGSMDDFKDFRKKKGNRGGVWYIMLALLVLTGAVYWYFFATAALPGKMYFSGTFLESGEISKKNTFSIKDRIVITYDNGGPIGEEYLQIHFSKKKGDEFKFYQHQTRQVMDKTFSRLEFHYQRYSFRDWGPGVYRVEIKNAKGELLSSKELTVNP